MKIIALSSSFHFLKGLSHKHVRVFGREIRYTVSSSGLVLRGERYIIRSMQPGVQCSLYTEVKLFGTRAVLKAAQYSTVLWHKEGERTFPCTCGNLNLARRVKLSLLLFWGELSI